MQAVPPPIHKFKIDLEHTLNPPEQQIYEPGIDPALDAFLSKAWGAPVAVTNVAEPLTISQLMTMDTRNDPDCLLGNRFLCKGGSLLLVGQTGIGKSSLEIQAAIMWALGRDLFGIQPTRKLKSLIIQAENDDGDLAEAVQGVVRGLNLGSELDSLDRKIVIVKECARTREAFAELVEAYASELKPDLVWIDPLLAYIGADVSKQEASSGFLRNLLNPIAARHGFAYCVVHHTGKPAKDKRYAQASDSYYGIGSSDVPNWARAILNLRQVAEGMEGNERWALYELRAVKRGPRSGLKPAPNAERDVLAYLEHGKQGMCWIHSDRSDGDAVDGNAEHVDRVIVAMGDASWTYANVLRLIQDTLPRKENGRKVGRSLAAQFFTRHLKIRVAEGASRGQWVVAPPGTAISPDEE